MLSDLDNARINDLFHSVVFVRNYGLQAGCGNVYAQMSKLLNDVIFWCVFAECLLLVYA